MEPRPQSTRAPQPQPTSRQPAAARPPEETGHYHQPDPTMMVAPPRTDYDYSPLDLAPPGQRRRRQLVAAALGGLLMLVLVAAIVFAFLVLRDPGGGDGESDLAAMQTSIAATDAAERASTPAATEPAVDATEVAGAGDAGQTTATASLGAAGEQAAVQPTQAAASAGGGPTSEQLMAMLPSQDIMPVGLDQIADSSLTKQDVLAALGGSREAETKLNDWGWSGNAQRSFTAAETAGLAPDATTDITVSLHGFASDQAAAEALTYYSDVLATSGFQEVEVGDIGATNRMLVQPQEDGGTNVALYIQQGPVLYRIGGYSPGGDPTTNVVNVAQAVISQQAAATGQ
jgi:hypothetical protein